MKKFGWNAREKYSNMQSLRMDFDVLEMKVGETLTKYRAQVMGLAKKMRNNEGYMKEVTIVKKILRSLTKKFNYVVVSIEKSKDIDKLTIDELQSSQVVHEHKFIRPSVVEHALSMIDDNSYIVVECVASIIPTKC